MKINKMIVKVMVVTVAATMLIGADGFVDRLYVNALGRSAEWANTCVAYGFDA